MSKTIKKTTDQHHFECLPHVKLSLALLSIFSCNEAVILSYLIGISEKFDLKKSDGWFFHTYKQIEKEIYRNKNQQNPIITSLRNDGYIEIELRGLPPIRWFRINYKQILKKLEEAAMSRGETLPKNDQTDESEKIQPQTKLYAKVDPLNDLYSKVFERKTLNVEPEIEHPKKMPQSVKVISIKKSTDVLISEVEQENTPELNFDKQYSNELIKVLIEKRLMSPTAKTSRWYLQFKELRKDWDNDTDRIKKVLDWYLENINSDEYLPKAFSSKSFREKFVRIELMMIRKEKERDRTKPNSKERKYILENYGEEPKYPIFDKILGKHQTKIMIYYVRTESGSIDKYRVINQYKGPVRVPRKSEVE